jgi:hypothetical protein
VGRLSGDMDDALCSIGMEENGDPYDVFMVGVGRE